ncbi:GntR family transcriptional regulator [Propionibacterium australiense]|uniref:FCD domain-containing protein n=1 Tax=Propionibacterium australiense TaxID=119981 RepID=A0A383S673_9ACTN|nr:GntR family transcriptional regulator [Propionibacterium australiense]RLP09029.1 FCD domain-containing protein [Propionibacterium australiense]RLP09138.1 FCD domain-containing protein [Propionibacterium australiense]SYZ33490.1 Transcription regulator HTH, GntR [Propionibacterium australiense]VEH91753.1 L-lactate utilization operon repressor [Propionibacterium australiense]
MKSAAEGLSGFNPLSAHGLRDEVYDAILEVLLAGQLPPASPLSIDGLAKSMSVSQTPVREALARLEHTGLVTREAHRGYRVAPPMSREQIAELVDARLVLEPSALHRAMQRDPETLLQSLNAAFATHKQWAARMAEPHALEDPALVKRYFESDWMFHQAILDHCGNRYLSRAVNSLSFSVHRMRQTLGTQVSDASFAIEEHSAILDAVATGDPDAAADAMTEHLRKVLDRCMSDAPAES